MGTPGSAEPAAAQECQDLASELRGHILSLGQNAVASEGLVQGYAACRSYLSSLKLSSVLSIRHKITASKNHRGDQTETPSSLLDMADDELP